MKRIICLWMLILIMFAVDVGATVTTTNSRIQYACNGSTTVFAYNFKVYEDDDLNVLKADSSNSETTLILNTDYTVSGSGDDAGGNVTLTTGSVCASEYTLTILRDVDITQITDFVDGQRISASSLESPPDKSRIIDQQFLESVDRALKLPESSTLTNVDVPISASRVIGWDSAGTALTTYSLSAVSNADFDTLANHGNSISTAISNIGAGKQSLYCMTATSLTTNSTMPSNIQFIALEGCEITTTGYTLTINGSFHAGLYKVFLGAGTINFGEGAVSFTSPYWWGAIGGDASDYTVAIQAAVNAGNMLINGNFNATNISIPSDRLVTGTAIIKNTVKTNPLFLIDGVSNVTIKGDLFLTSDFELVDGATEGGVVIDGTATNITVEDIKATKLGVGVWVKDGTDIYINDNIITDNRLAGLAVTISDNVNIEGNYVDNNGYNSGGFTHNMYFSGPNGTITGNYFGTVNEDINLLSVVFKSYEIGGRRTIDNLTFNGNTVVNGFSARSSQGDAASVRLANQYVNVSYNLFTDGTRVELIDGLDSVMSHNVMRDVGYAGLSQSTTNGSVAALSAVFAHNTLIDTPMFSSSTGLKGELDGFKFIKNTVSGAVTSVIRHPTTGVQFRGTLTDNVFSEYTDITSSDVTNDFDNGHWQAPRYRDVIGMLLDYQYPYHDSDGLLDEVRAFDYDDGHLQGYQEYGANDLMSTPTNVPIGAEITYYLQSAGGATSSQFLKANNFYLYDATELVATGAGVSQAIKFLKATSTRYVQI